MASAVEARQKLESQLQENKAVQKVCSTRTGRGMEAYARVLQEFSILDDDANIYKLVGPVLLKQDKPEAVMNVDKRLEFIEAEMFVSRRTVLRPELTRVQQAGRSADQESRGQAGQEEDGDYQTPERAPGGGAGRSSGGGIDMARIPKACLRSSQDRTFGYFSSMIHMCLPTQKKTTRLKT